MKSLDEVALDRCIVNLFLRLAHSSAVVIWLGSCKYALQLIYATSGERVCVRAREDDERERNKYIYFSLTLSIWDKT